MRIEYQKLTIQNFKGVLGERTIEFTGSLTQILGANHTGKTTTADAVQWLLFGKNSEDSSVFGISPKDEDGNVIPDLENRVILELTADGRPIVLEKVRKEVRTKPRNGEEEKLSYPCSYFINGNKYQEKDFKQEIEALCRENLYRTLTNPAYFPSLQADSQRQLLTKMVGEPSLEQIAAGREDFKGILQQLAGTDLQRFREHLSYRIKELKKEIEEIPSRLNEQETELAPLKAQNINFEQLEKDIHTYEQEIEQCDKEMQDNSRIIDSEFEARSQKRREVTQKKSRMQEIQNFYQMNNANATRAKNKAIQDAQDMVDAANRKIKRNDLDIEEAKSEIQKVEIDTKNFRTEWGEVEALEFKWDTTKETCPTCGQRLPQGDIDRLRNEAEERFNGQKGEAQDRLDQKATVLKKRKSDAEAKLRTANDIANSLLKELNHAQELLDGEKATAAEESFYQDDEEWQKLNAEVKAMTHELENSGSEGTQQAENVNRQIQSRKAEWNRKRDEARDTLNIRNTIEAKEKRIAELEEKNKKLNQQLTELEGQDYIAEQFTQAYIQNLEQKVNALFKNVQFRMFKRLLNGNLQPICECTMHGTPYQDLSNSEKINAGIDIINAMCEFNQTWVPMFVDNAESINDVTPSRSQQILLIVSRDKQLTIIK